jgi:AcrR family transcriptional regulator
MADPAPPPGLRADAAGNRELILEAAREIFARHGIDVPMDRVARTAGVGAATLYRRFPTRDDLVFAVFEPKLEAYVAAARAGAAHDDCWSGFCEYVRAICELQAADVGFANVLSLTFPVHEALTEKRRESYRLVSGLIERCQVAGVLRADFATEDIALLLAANAGVVTATGRVATKSSARFAAFMIEAFRGPGNGDLPPAPSRACLTRAIHESNER